MFSKLLGTYLVDNNYISKEQLEAVKEKVKSVRVKLGLIAVAEDMMTEAQANDVNRIQAVQDKRFGDIAVEKGYLSEEQVSELLKKQGNSYMQFVQTIVDLGILSLDDINKYVEEYRKSNWLTALDIDLLKSGDTNKEILVLVKTPDEHINKHLSLVARNIIRFISTDCVITEIEKVGTYSPERLGYQKLEGLFPAMLGFGADDKAIALVAGRFANERFDKADEDSYDAVCEFTNCINGLFASELSESEIDIDMLPPMSGDNLTVSADNMYVMHLLVEGICVDAVSVINAEANVE